MPKTLPLSIPKPIADWFKQKDWRPFKFQQQCWEAMLAQKDGLLNAPTGSGKTFALFFPILIQHFQKASDPFKEIKGKRLRLLWITPLRALAKDLQRAMQEVVDGLQLPWEVARRTGDISSAEKAKLRRRLPEVLITTPESMHLIFTRKEHEKEFKNLQYIVIDEWHELLGSKRGVQTELVLGRLRRIQTNVVSWGISATIGNMDEAMEVLLGPKRYESGQAVRIQANIEKSMVVKPVIPDDMERFPWSGHLGINLADQVLDIIDQSNSTLLFTNTRGQSEIWFRTLLEKRPDLAGAIALHHGSLDREVREWVEWALHQNKMKLVVCTSSLDLGVDFSPVETVIQVGSPKGVARFLQRAGRSGHRPGATSVIHFVPTHALELIEALALRKSVEATLKKKHIQVEDRQPLINALDVLVQYVVTLCVSGPQCPHEIYEEVRQSFAYQVLSKDDWDFICQFVTTGGNSLKRYDDYHKLTYDENGNLVVKSRRVARRHRMSIGTISSEASMRVKWMKGGSLGTIEEYFISRLNLGDRFWFAGRMLELVQIKDMTAYVKKAKTGKGPIPSWLGGRMSLSSQMSDLLRKELHQNAQFTQQEPEVLALDEIFDIQRKWSIIPDEKQFLIECSSSREGVHYFFFPFEGRYVHEGMSSLIAWRIGRKMPVSFSIAMNDYGFELLTDRALPMEKLLAEGDLFSEEALIADIQHSLNDSELAKRRFRDISRIAGLLFSGFPGQSKSQRNLQMSSGLLFDVFKEYEPEHRLLQQAFDEVLEFQLDEARIRKALKRIQSQQIIFKHTERFTPFAFPIMVDRLRDKMSSEKLEDRIQKMIAKLSASI